MSRTELWCLAVAGVAAANRFLVLMVSIGTVAAIAMTVAPDTSYLREMWQEAKASTRGRG